MILLHGGERLQHGPDEFPAGVGVVLDGGFFHADDGVGVVAQVGELHERLLPDARRHALHDLRLTAVADVALAVLQHGGDGGGVGVLHQRHVPVGVKAALEKQVAGQQVGRAAVAPGHNALAPEEIRHVLHAVRVGGQPGAGKEVHVGSVDAVDDAHDGVAVALVGQGVGIHPADDREGVAGHHGGDVGAAGGLHHRDVKPFLGEIPFMDGHIQRQVADEMDGLRHGEARQPLRQGGEGAAEQRQADKQGKEFLHGKPPP